MEPSAFDLELATERILQHFGTATLEPFGCQGLPLAVQAAGAILAYLEETQRGTVGQLTSLHTYSAARFMALDPQTRRNLELFQGGRFGAGAVVAERPGFRPDADGRAAAAGVAGPAAAERGRHPQAAGCGGVACPAVQPSERRQDGSSERWPTWNGLINRVRGGAAQPAGATGPSPNPGGCAPRSRARGRGRVVPGVAAGRPSPLHRGGGTGRQRHRGRTNGRRGQRGDQSEPVCRRSWTSFAQPSVTRGPTWRDSRPKNGRARESRRSRWWYNRVFGYYLGGDSPSPQPRPDQLRPAAQTLVNAERFITPELKEYESRILNAQERIAELESALFPAGLPPDRRVVRSRAGDCRGARAGGRLRGAGRGGVPPRLHSASRRRERFVGDPGRTPPNRGTGTADGQLRAQRHDSVQRGLLPDGADRAQHGGQVDLHPAGSAHRPHGPDRQLRARIVGPDRAGGPHLHSSGGCKTTWRRASRPSW